MSVSAARGQIFSTLKDLRLLWQRTQEQWSDGVAREFLEQVWTPMEGATIATIGALDRLEQVLQQMRQECGHSESLCENGPDPMEFYGVWDL